MLVSRVLSRSGSLSTALAGARRCELLAPASQQRLIMPYHATARRLVGSANQTKAITVASAWSNAGKRIGAGVALALASASVVWNFDTVCEAAYSSTKDKEVDDENDQEGVQFYIPPAEESKMKIFSGNGNWHLANEISMHLGTSLGRATVKRYADGEVSVQIHDNVRGKDVFVVQPLGPPVNENLMELILMVTTMRRSSARHITAVIPYYGYSRSTSIKNSRTPIAAADIATLLQVAGIDRVITVDLHHGQIAGFFGPNTTVDNLDVSSLAIPYFQTKFLKRPVVVSPDANGAARAKVFRDKLIRNKMDADLALIVDHGASQRKLKGQKNNGNDGTEGWKESDLVGMDLVGDVKGCDCIIFDDMIDSAGRITRAAKKLKLAGARRVFAFATHGLFLGKAYERIEKSDLIEVVCVNTIPLATSNAAGVSSWVYSNKVNQLSVAALLAEAIRRIHKKKSVSNLA